MCGYMFAFLMVLYLEMELLDSMGTLSWTVWGTGKHFPKSLSFYICSSNVQGFLQLLILTNTCYYHFEYGHSSLLKWSDISSLHLVLSGEKHLWCGAVVGVNRKKVFETLSSSFRRPLNIFVMAIEYSCGSRLRI